jgi:acyl-CoA thioester hydrolase
MTTSVRPEPFDGAQDRPVEGRARQGLRQAQPERVLDPPERVLAPGERVLAPPERVLAPPERVLARGERSPGGFSFPIRVYWEDTDAGGIVFYANYLKFFERARTEWLRALGLEQSRLREETGGMFIVSDTALRYFRPARLDDELLVTARLERAGGASMSIAQQAMLAKGGAVLCEGTIRIAWVRANDLKPGRIPANILQAIQTTE